MTAMNTTTEARFVAPSRAARQFDISKGAMYELLRTEQIRSVRLGRRILIPIAELDRFAESLAR